MEAQEQKVKSDSFFKKIIKNITIEPLIICYFLPFSFGWVFIENLNLEKSCRSNINQFTNITNDICQLFVRKEEYKITCDNDTRTTYINEDILSIISLKHSNIFEFVKDNLTSVIDAICDVEESVQLHLAHINTIRNPISSIGPFIIILFAAGWSDKKGRQIPCMVFPFLGEAFGFFCNSFKLLDFKISNNLILFLSFICFCIFYGYSSGSTSIFVSINSINNWC